MVTNNKQNLHLQKILNDEQFFRYYFWCNLTMTDEESEMDITHSKTKMYCLFKCLNSQVVWSILVRPTACIKVTSDEAQNRPVCRLLSPEWTILSHVNCFIQEEVTGFHILLDSLHPRSTRVSWWSPPVLQGEAVKIFLACISSDIRTIWPNRQQPMIGQ